MKFKIFNMVTKDLNRLKLVLVEKKKTELPARLTNVVFCRNPRCITTTEQELPHIFLLTDRKNREYRCLYCEAKCES